MENINGIKLPSFYQIGDGISFNTIDYDVEPKQEVINSGTVTGIKFTKSKVTYIVLSDNRDYLMSVISDKVIYPTEEIAA